MTTQPKSTEPVRIKLYGLFSTTKRRYVVQVVVAAVMMAFLLFTWMYFRTAMRGQMLETGTPLMAAAVRYWDLVPWIVAVVAVLQIVEAWVAFRAFARKRAETPPAAPPGQS